MTKLLLIYLWTMTKYYNMRKLREIRLILCGVLFGMGVLMANEANKTEQKQKHYEKIKAALDAKEITLEEAQKLWITEVRKINRK